MRGDLDLFIFFFMKKSYTQKKHEKGKSDLRLVLFIRLKSIKSIKSNFSQKKHKKQTSDLHSVIFICLKSIKSIKSNFLRKSLKCKQVFADASNNRQTTFFSQILLKCLKRKFFICLFAFYIFLCVCKISLKKRINKISNSPHNPP